MLGDLKLEDKYELISSIVETFLGNYGHKDDIQTKIASSKLLALSVIANLDYAGNIDKTRKMIKNFDSNMVGKPRVSKRLVKLVEYAEPLMLHLAKIAEANTLSQVAKFFCSRFKTNSYLSKHQDFQV